MKTMLFVLGAMVLLVNSVNAQPLADQVPADAVVYVGWAGIDSMGPGFEGSHFQGVLKATQFSKLVSNTFEQIERAGEREADAETARKTFAWVRELTDAAWRFPSAVYVGNIEASAAGEPQAVIHLLIRAGNQSAGLAKRLTDTLPPDASTGPDQVTIEQRDGLVVLRVATAAFKEPAGPHAKTLDRDERFKAAMAKVVGSPVAVAYGDFDALVAALDKVAARDHAPSQRWPQIKDALGLNGLHSIVWAGGFEGKEWVTALFIDAPAPRRGVATLLESKPLDPQLIKLVPKNGGYFTAFNFDLGALFNEIHTHAGQIDPQAPAQMDGALAMVAAQTGVDLEKDLFRALGSQWLLYSDPTTAGGNGLGFVIVSPLNDAAKAQAALEKIETIANQRMAQSGPDGPRIHFQVAEQEGVQVHFVPIMVATPAWAVHDGKLYVGMFPQSVTTAATFRPTQPGSIMDADQYAALWKRLGRNDATGVSFVDLPTIAPQAYQALLGMTQMLQGALAAMPGPGAPPQMTLLPPLGQIMPHLSPAMSVSWIDAKGYYSRGISPFPGATLLSPSTNLNVASGAMILGITLPALGAARRTAQQMQSSTQVRGIHQGCILYAQGNNMKFPSDIGTLYAGKYFTVEYTISPLDKGHAVPPEFKAWDDQKQVAWINANTSYVLVPGLTDDTDTTKVAMFEKLHSPGMNGIPIAYNDNHVEFTKLPEARAIILKQTGKTLEEWSGLPKPDPNAPGGVDPVSAPLPAPR